MTKVPLLVLDTNAWVSRQLLMLNTPLGASILFSLQRRGGALGLPEVIEKELAKVVGTLAAEAAQQFDDAASYLDDLGLHQVDQPPFDLESIRQHAMKRIDALEPFINRADMSVAQSRRALARVIAEQPPNGPKNQQFKDSLIWEAIVDWADEYDVTFITGDRGFFEGRDFTRGLAEDLRGEAERMQIVVYPVSAISTYLKELSRGLTRIEEEKLQRQIWVGLMARVEAAGEKWHFVLGERRYQHHAAFLTRTSGALAVQFSLTFRIKHRRRASGDLEGTYSISGSGLYLVEEDRLAEMVVDAENVWLEQPSGKHLNQGTFRFPREETDDYVGPRIL